ncbi:MAG: YD repeat-containing protein, partial [Bacteroidales bacterium]|nr:YD repeat-containing protein [Bacteroidales bacterium]
MTKFEYNPLGLLLSSTDPENHSTQYLYDLAGKLVERTHPDAGKTSYRYAPSGQVFQMQTQDLENRGVQIEYQYNYNQLIQTIYPDNPEMNVKYQYGDHHAGNEAGRLLYQEDATGMQQFSYGKL